MILKTVYTPTVYVEEQTGRIINREELRNLSYTSRLGQNEKIKDTTKVIHSTRIISITGVQTSLKFYVNGLHFLLLII